MNSDNLNTKNELELAWNNLSRIDNEASYNNKIFIQKSLDSKSILSIISIGSKIKKELIGHAISMVLLMYISISGILHEVKHSEQKSLSIFFITFLIFTVSFYCTFIIRQYFIYHKIKRFRVNEYSTVQQLQSNYDLLKLYLKSDKIWMSIILGVGTYMFSSYYIHSTGHLYPGVYVLILCIGSFCIGLISISIINRKKYGAELKNMNEIIEGVAREKIN